MLAKSIDLCANKLLSLVIHEASIGTLSFEAIFRQRPRIIISGPLYDIELTGPLNRLCHRILDLAAQHGVERVVTFAALGTAP